jgi:hypothetical protein
VRVDGYASKTGPTDHNWSLSCWRASNVAAELKQPLAPELDGIPESLITVFMHGETTEFPSEGENRRATISANFPPGPTPPSPGPTPPGPSPGPTPPGPLPGACATLGLLRPFLVGCKAAENLLGAELLHDNLLACWIPLVTSKLGSQTGSVWLDYLDSSKPLPRPKRIFTGAGEIVDGFTRHHRTAEAEAEIVKAAAAMLSSTPQCSLACAGLDQHGPPDQCNICHDLTHAPQ